MIETCERFDEHVAPLVLEFVATGREHVQRFVQVEVVVAAIADSSVVSSYDWEENDIGFDSRTGD